VVVRTACWAVLAIGLAGVLAACGGGHGAATSPAASAAVPAPAAIAEQLVAVTPAPADLPSRLIVEGGLLATQDLSVVHDLAGATAPLYALVPPGPDVVPAGEARVTCEITTTAADDSDAAGLEHAAQFANLEACQGGPIGCGTLEIGSIAGQSRKATEASVEKLAEYRACLQHLHVGPFAGPPVDGRFLLQPGPAQESAAVSVSVIVYPSAEAFTTSLRDVATGTAFRPGTVPGRFAPSSLPGCRLQFYPPTASLLAWCDDAKGARDPEHDATVGRIAGVLTTGRPPADVPPLDAPYAMP
jgi:hypothetical protein